MTSWGRLLALLFVCFSAHAETVSVVLQKPDGKTESAQLIYDPNGGSLQIKHEGVWPLPLLVDPHLKEGIKNFIVKNAAVVAVPHGATGLYANASVKSLVLDMSDPKTNQVRQAMVEVSYLHSAGSAPAQSVSARVPLSWTTEPHKFEQAKLSVDIGSGPVEAQLVKIENNRATVRTGNRELTVPVTSLLAKDPHPSAEAVLYRSQMSNAEGEALRSEVARVIAERHSLIDGDRRKLVDEAMPKWIAEVTAARTADDYHKALSAINPPAAREQVLLRTVGHFFSLKPSLDQVGQAITSKGSITDVQVLVKRLALPLVKTPQDLTKLMAFQAPERKDKTLTVAEMDFFARYAAPQFFKAGGKPADFVSVVNSLRVPDSMIFGEQKLDMVPAIKLEEGHVCGYMQLLDESLPAFFKAGGRLEDFERLMKRTPFGPARSFLVGRHRNALLLDAKPRPSFEEARRLFELGVDKEVSIHVARALMKLPGANPDALINLVRDLRRGRTSTFSQDNALEDAPDQSHQSYADVLSRWIVRMHQPGASDPMKFAPSQLLLLQKEVGAFDLRLQIAEMVSDNARNARDYLDAVKQLEPQGSFFSREGQRMQLQDFLQRTFKRRFLTQSPTVHEINELLSSPGIEPGSETQQVMLAQVLDLIRSEKDYKQLKLPYWVERKPFFRAALNKFREAHPTWTRGPLDSVCKLFRKMVPRRRSAGPEQGPENFASN